MYRYVIVRDGKAYIETVEKPFNIPRDCLHIETKACLDTVNQYIELRNKYVGKLELYDKLEQEIDEMSDTLDKLEDAMEEQINPPKNVGTLQDNW